jgi:hypothetical protein
VGIAVGVEVNTLVTTAEVTSEPPRVLTLLKLIFRTSFLAAALGITALRTMLPAKICSRT